MNVILIEKNWNTKSEVNIVVVVVVNLAIGLVNNVMKLTLNHVLFAAVVRVHGKNQQ